MVRARGCSARGNQGGDGQHQHHVEVSPHKSDGMSDITWQASLQKTSRHYAMQFGAVVGSVRKWGDGWMCSLGSSGRFGKFGLFVSTGNHRRFGPLFSAVSEAKAYFEENWQSADAEGRLGGES